MLGLLNWLTKLTAVSLVGVEILDERDTPPVPVLCGSLTECMSTATFEILESVQRTGGKVDSLVLLFGERSSATAGGQGQTSRRRHTCCYTGLRQRGALVGRGGLTPSLFQPVFQVKKKSTFTQKTANQLMGKKQKNGALDNIWVECIQCYCA